MLNKNFLESPDTSSEQQIHEQTKLQEESIKITINGKNSLLTNSSDGKITVTTIDNVYDIQRVYPANEWNYKEEQETLKKITEERQKNWLFSVLLGLKWVFIITNHKIYNSKNFEKITFYYTDKLTTALKEQIFKQKKSLLDSTFDFTQIQGEARKQLLIPYRKNGFFIENFTSFKSSLYDVLKKRKILQNSSFFSYGDKMKVLGLSAVQLWNKMTVFNDLWKIIYSTGDISSLIFILKKTINDFVSSEFHILQKAQGLDLTSLIIQRGKQINVSSLVNSFKKEASDLTIEELKILKQLKKISFSNLQTQVQTWIDFKLDSYKLKIQKGLEKFATSKIKKIEIEGTTYQIDLLLKKTNLKLIGSQLPNDAKTQLLSLVKAKITSQELTKILQNVDKQNILAFQKNWDAGKVSTYLLWLSVFDIKEVKLSQNKVVPVGGLANAIQSMLTAEKLDFTKLSGEARKQLLNLLNTQGKIRAEKTFQDDVWRQIKNHQKWKAIEGLPGQLVLESIRTLLLEIQDLGINKVAHPFFPEGYDLSFLKDDKSWKKISFKDLLQGMKVAVNGTYVEFYSHLFPNQVVFQVPMKKLSTVFSEITIANTIKALKDVINAQQKKDLESKPSKENNKISEEKNKQKKSNISNNKQKSNISNNNLTIGLSVAGGTLVFVTLGGFLYWFFKVKK